MDVKREAAKELTNLAESSGGFSFLRLGDGELRYLIDAQERGFNADRYPQVDPSVITCEQALGRVGLKQKYYSRIKEAYEECDLLDLYINQEKNSSQIKNVNLEWADRSIRDPNLCNIIQYWTQHEFGNFINDKKCLFYGAEADILGELVKDDDYLRRYADYWPNPEDHLFRLPPNFGRDIEQRVDDVKAKLSDFAHSHDLSVLFISLGGASKILCYELARDHGLTCIDWGSMMRGLSYCGSMGYSNQRAPHHPFFARLPLETFMSAVQRARPEISEAEVIGRANAQLCLDLQKKVKGKFSPADIHDPDSFDPSQENLNYFWQNYRYYQKNIQPRALRSVEALKIAWEMEYWLMKKGIGVKGWIFRNLVKLKGKMREAKKK